jgi:hypothetical protein
MAPDLDALRRLSLHATQTITRRDTILYALSDRIPGRWLRVSNPTEIRDVAEGWRVTTLTGGFAERLA